MSDHSRRAAKMRMAENVAGFCFAAILFLIVLKLVFG